MGKEECSRISYTLRDENGIHARPAGVIVATAKKFKSDIKLQMAEDGKMADAKKIFAVMGLGAKQGDSLWIEGCGEDAAIAVNALAEEMKKAGL